MKLYDTFQLLFEKLLQLEFEKPARIRREQSELKDQKVNVMYSATKKCIATINRKQPEVSGAYKEVEAE